MNKVMVKIHGAEYPMVGEKSEQHMLSVAKYVDEEMTKVTQSNPRLSLSVAAIVTAVNITDFLFECSEDFEKAAKENEELKKKLESPNEELELELKKLKSELEIKDQEVKDNIIKIDELNNVIQAQKNEIDNLSNCTEGSKTELESYKNEVEELKLLLEESNERAKIAESLASEFQNKAYQVQLKYTEIENELKYIRATTR